MYPFSASRPSTSRHCTVPLPGARRSVGRFTPVTGLRDRSLYWKTEDLLGSARPRSRGRRRRCGRGDRRRAASRNWACRRRSIDLALHRQAVEHVVLRVELDRELAGRIRRRCRRPRFRLRDRVADRAVDRPRRAHQHVAAERHRVLAGLAEHAEEALALLAGGEQPAVFDAEHADRDAGLADEVEHLRRCSCRRRSSA